MRARGFTLLELMVASGLLLLAASLMAQLLWPSFRLALRGAARAEVQERTALALQRMGEDLQSTGACGISLSDQPENAFVMLAVQPIAEITPDPRVVYSRSLVVWAWERSSGRLGRYVWGDDPGVSLDADFPVRLQEAVLLGLAARLGEAQLSLRLSDVTSFQVRSQAPHDDIESPLTLHLELHPKGEEFRLDRQVVLRNGY